MSRSRHVKAAVLRVLGPTCSSSEVSCPAGRSNEGRWGFVVFFFCGAAPCCVRSESRCHNVIQRVRRRNLQQLLHFGFSWWVCGAIVLLSERFRCGRQARRRVLFLLYRCRCTCQSPSDRRRRRTWWFHESCRLNKMSEGGAVCVCVTEVICKKKRRYLHSIHRMQPYCVCFFICISKNEALLLYKYKYILYKKNTRRNECQKCLNYFKHCVWLPLLVLIIFVLPRECVFL